MNKELNERKQVILLEVIKNYLETGEPVGSRTISKIGELDLSPATIRNEMADLEELGYITSPHTSAGRIPTDKGYRFYVDMLLKDKQLILEERENLILEKTEKLERLLQNTAKLLASQTNYATLVSSPQNTNNCIKFIQISILAKNQILIVIVFNGNMVKNKVINISKAISNEEIFKLNMLLNTYLSGITLENINIAVISKIKEQGKEFILLIDEIFNAISEYITEEDIEVYTSGATNILKYPELRDKESAEELLLAFTEKKEIANIVNKKIVDEKNDIQVYIGTENEENNMKDCTVLTTTYEIEEGLKGTIGIVGPKRMNYKKAMGALKKIKEELDNINKK